MEILNKKITPALFVSHGSPMNAIAQNEYTNDLNKIGKKLSSTNAIFVISAHWETNGISITSSENLSTYHDFGGFPKELFDIEYPVKGALHLIPEIERLVGEPIKHDNQRGLDHGAWSMLVHLFPKGNIPVLQLSLDRTKSFEQHYELAKKIAPLREQNVLILLSGNLTHNISSANFRNVDATPVEWAVNFDEIIKNAFLNSEVHTLINIKTVSKEYKMNHPSDDHFLPLLYLMGVENEKDEVTFPHMSWQHATLSMRHILLN